MPAANCDLSDIRPSQNMAQDSFMVGAAHESRPIAGIEILNLVGILHFGAPQAPNNKLGRQHLNANTTTQYGSWEAWSGTAIYLTFHCVRIWYNAVLWWRPRTNQGSCVAGAIILGTVGISLIRCLRLQAINLVLQALKDLGRRLPEA